MKRKSFDDVLQELSYYAFSENMEYTEAVKEYIINTEKYLNSIWCKKYDPVSNDDRERLGKLVCERVVIKGGKWNGKIYGGLYGYLHIYINNHKVPLRQYLNRGFLWGDWRKQLLQEYSIEEWEEMRSEGEEDRRWREELRAEEELDRQMAREVESYIQQQIEAGWDPYKD